jgi:iron complex outermembrane receptor protein
MKTLQNNNAQRKTVLASLCAAALIEASFPAAVLAADVLEEVIVTARKREESLQESPVAVSVMTGEALQESGMRDIIKLAEVVPNLNFNTGGAGGAAAPNIRGVGARNNGANFDSGVAIYLDGVYVSRADGAILDSVDIQSVQVVRGPQGTLFGKNATGGAIIYATNKPTEVFEGHVEVDAGNYDRQDGQITVNVPLIADTLYSRASLYSTQRDGYVEDVVSGDDFGNVDRWGGQAQLRWLASERVLVDLNGIYGKVDQTTQGWQCRPATGVPGSGWLTGLQDELIVLPSTEKTFMGHCEDAAALDKDEVYTPWSDELPPKYEAKTKSVAATADWEINDILTLKSITAWRNIEAGEANDVFGVDIPFQTRTNFGRELAENRNTDWYSEELQLNGSAFEEKVDYVVGLFASQEKTDAGTNVGVSGPFFNALRQPDTAFYLAQATELQTDNISYAAFSQADWSITEVWRLSLGIRYTWEQRELRRITSNPDLATLSTGAPAEEVIPGTIYSFPDGPDSFNPDHGYVLLDDQTKKIDNDDWNPMGSIQYLFGDGEYFDNGNAYFTYATGFLSGGISEGLDFLTGELAEYKPEQATNYEIGLKADALESTLRLNTALFYTQYDDRQLVGIGVNPTNGTIASVTNNAAKSSIAGIEIEALWLPVTNLEITFNTAFNHGDIEEFEDLTVAVVGELPAQDCVPVEIGPGRIVDGCNVDRSDEDLPGLPKQVYYVAAQYLVETGYGSFTPRVDVTYKRDINGCLDYASCQWLDGKGTEFDIYSLNARLTWLSKDQKIRVTAYGNNLTDNQANSASLPLIGASESWAVAWSDPFTYGIELAYTW